MKRWLKGKWHDFWIGYHCDMMTKMSSLRYKHAYQYHADMLNYHLDQLVQMDKE